MYLKQPCVLNNLPPDFPCDVVGIEVLAVRSGNKEVPISPVLTVNGFTDGLNIVGKKNLMGV